MPKIYNKIINSPTPPKNTSDIWECNGRLYLYKGGGWEALKTDSPFVSSGADWNAQEGKPGYIANKPFGIIKSNNGQITNINSLFVITENAFYPTNDLFIKYNNKIALLAKEKQELYWGDGITVDIDDEYFYLMDDGDSNTIVITENDFNFELIIVLRSDFIPNTVIKTTPQKLSDKNKNQALANLGIADLLEALKPVHLSEELPVGTVTQEQLDEIGLTEKVINNILNGYTNRICIGNSTYIVTYANKNDNVTEIIFACFMFDNGTVDSFTQFTYYKILDEITIEFREL